MKSTEWEIVLIIFQEFENISSCNIILDEEVTESDEKEMAVIVPNPDTLTW